MATQSVWGIDIGQCALKAMKLRLVNGELRVEAFDIVEHEKVLSQPDAEPDQLIRTALETFLSRNSLEGSSVLVAAPGKSGITRFVKLPPVDAKQIPEMVRYEANQQIPFDINEVIWSWQAFKDPNSPDVEVGIFAMKRTDVGQVLERYTEVGINVDGVQMAPLALFNFMDYDGLVADEGATLLVDIGADKTDLVVCDGGRMWTRTMQRGGNAFTDALAKAFKLSFSKAEKLKCTAATSKYARQVFQAMRPVFADVAQEVQRSLGFYNSLHRESRFKKVVGLGGGFRLPGLQKYLEQNLGIPVVRVDAFNKLTQTETSNSAAFVEGTPGLAVVYGLCLQGLGISKIQTNLLPSEISRARRWSAKRSWFAVSAALLLLALGGKVYRDFADRATLAETAKLASAEAAAAKAEGLQSEMTKVKGGDQGTDQDLAKFNEMQVENDTMDRIYSAVSELVRQKMTHQGLYTNQGLEELKKIDRTKRKAITIKHLYVTSASDDNDIPAIDFDVQRRETPGMGGMGGPGAMPMGMPNPMMMGGPSPNPMIMGGGSPAIMGGPSSPPVMGGPPVPGAPPAAAKPKPAKKPGEAGGKAYIVYMEGVTPQPESTAVGFLSSDLRDGLEEVCKADVEVRAKKLIKQKPAAENTSVKLPPDPLTGEDTSKDTRFIIGWVIALKDKSAPPAAGGGPGGAPGAANGSVPGMAGGAR